MKRKNIIFVCFILLIGVLMVSTVSVSNNTTTGHFNVISKNSKYEVGDSYDFELLNNKGEYICVKTVNININGIIIMLKVEVIIL